MHSPERKKQEYQTKIRTALQILTQPRKIGNWLLDKVPTVPVDGKVMQVNVACKGGMPKALGSSNKFVVLHEAVPHFSEPKQHLFLLVLT